jgi:hypothetical protein
LQQRSRFVLEVLDHLITSEDENLLSGQLVEQARELVTTAVMVINGYMRYLKRASPDNE